MNAKLKSKKMENIGKPRYGIIENGIFGTRIVAGIVTGKRYTEDNRASR